MMKKLIVLVAMLIFQCYFTQVNMELKFETNIPDSENRWVVLPNKMENGNFFVSFVYYDTVAGYTMEVMGSLSQKDGLYYYEEDESKKTSSYKYRVENLGLLVHPFTDHQLKELKLPKEPDWLKNYTYEDPDQLIYLKKLSAMNGARLSRVALPKLQQLYDGKMRNETLYFELAFANNALGDFQSAEKITKEAFTNKITSDWLKKEHVFALGRQGKIKELDVFLTQNLAGYTKEAAKAESIINTIAFSAGNDQLSIAKKWLEHLKKQDFSSRYERNINQLQQIIKNKESKVQ